MLRSTPLEANARRHDSWFEKYQGAYVSELLALRSFVPLQGLGFDIAVGTGRFAAPLGLQVGVDPAASMLAEARKRGISIVQGVVEALPFADGSFDHALVVTTLCFVDSPAAMRGEARRVLRPGGRLVIGFIDRATAVGRFYQDRRQGEPVLS